MFYDSVDEEDGEDTDDDDDNFGEGAGGWWLYGEGLGSRKLLQAFIKEWGYRVVEWFPQQPEINWSLWWVWKLSI